MADHDQSPTPRAAKTSAPPTKAGRDSGYFRGNPTFLKWSIMLAALFWVAIYKLSENQAEVGGFVYANF